MKERTIFGFEITQKKGIEEIISESDIPEDEIHVSIGGKHKKDFKRIGPKVSVALVACADRRYGCPDYTIAYRTMKVQKVESQKTAIVMNHSVLKREKEEFRNNGLYVGYRLEIISPPLDIMAYLKRGLAPWAMPDAPYRG